MKISIAAILIGIMILFFLLRYNQKNTTKIADLKQGQIEEITGMINSVYVSKEKHVFLKITDSSGEISVVAFNNSNIDGIYDLGIGDQISVLGRVENYKGRLEIIANVIKVL